MKNLFLTLVFAIIATMTFAQSQVKVNGYYRSNGTYVQPHYRTAPNHTVRDNWSTYPNVNPHTGKTGTKHYQYKPSTPTYNYPQTRSTNNKYNTYIRP